jgi:hypothetical protein
LLQAGGHRSTAGTKNGAYVGHLQHLLGDTAVKSLSRWWKGKPEASGVHTVLALFLHRRQTPRRAYLQEESLAPGADPHAGSKHQAEVCHGCRADESKWVVITTPPAIRSVDAQVRDPASKRNAWRQTNLRNRQNCGASVRASEFK